MTRFTDSWLTVSRVVVRLPVGPKSFGSISVRDVVLWDWLSYRRLFFRTDDFQMLGLVMLECLGYVGLHARKE